MPLAGLSTDQILQVSTHSAAIRAGTIHDGQFHQGKSIPKDLASGMVDPLSRRMVTASLAEPNGDRISRNIRRPRHIRDASIAQAHSPKSSTQGICKTINQQCIETQRAGTAARPYAEILPSKVRDSVGQPNGAPRGGMLSGSAASRTFH